MCLYISWELLHHRWLLNSTIRCCKEAGLGVNVYHFCCLFNHFAALYMQISTSLLTQIGEHLRLLDLILWMNSTTATDYGNNEQNKATTATSEMRFGSFPNYIFKILAVGMTSTMVTVREREEFDECREAFWLNALTFPSSSWDNSHTCCSQPVGLLAPPYPASPDTPRRRSALNAADKLTGNNNAAPEWLTANSENTQQLGFGRGCVYLGVHLQWLASLSGCFRSRFGMPLSHPTLPFQRDTNTHIPFITLQQLLHKICSSMQECDQHTWNINKK